MFSEFNKSTFPLVKVTLNNKPESDIEFNQFTNEWIRLYNEKRDFQFLFDTMNVSNPALKYCVKMAKFIKELRKREYHYLQESIILINNNKIKYLLDFIFTIQPPVAPVYIYHIKNGYTENMNLNRIKNHSETIRVMPGKPLLPIF